MQRVAAAVLPVLAALLAAAPHAHADAPWVEVKAAGFTVVSDGSEKEARAVLGQLAQVRALLKRVWPWARLDPSRPVVVLAVRDEADLRQLLPEYWEKRNALHPAGVFVTAPDRHWVALRMDVARNRAEDETWGNPYHLVFHEYVHLVLRLNFDRLPAWLNEGLAEFWGNTIIDGDRIYQGRYIGYHISTLRNATLLPIEGLLSARSDQYSDGNRATVLYAQSWALVHYLILGSDQRRGQIDRYAELLRAGRSDEDARREAFGDVSALGRELDSYVRRYAFRSLRTIAALDTATGPVSSRVVPPAESLGLRAGFHVATGRTREAAALAAEALKADPSVAAAHEALALAAWHAGRRDEALAELEKAIASPSATDFAHYLLGRSVWSSSHGDRIDLDRVQASLSRAIELNPDFAEAHEALALVENANGAPVGQTLPLAVRASLLEPTVIGYRITALRLAAHGGGVQQARSEAQLLLAWARGEDRKRVGELIQELSDPRRLPPEAACADGHAPACNELGRRYRGGVGVPKDAARAAALFEKACQGGESDACASLGSLLRRGEGGTTDAARAESLLQAACDQGSGRGCGELGSLLLGRGTPEATRQAASLYQKACEGDSPSSCAFLAQLLELGRGFPRDAARARRLFRKACDGGYSQACSRAAPSKPD